MFKTIKYLVTAISLGTVALVSCNTNAYDKVACSIFTEDQRIIMQNALVEGTPHNYGWTLAAISWKESSAGVKPINWSDPSFGVFHSAIKTVAKRYNAKGQIEELELANRLVYDFQFAAKAAIDELDFWKKVHKGNWMKMWQGYNGGFSGSQASKDYAVDIAKKIKFLKTNECLFDDYVIDQK